MGLSAEQLRSGLDALAASEPAIAAAIARVGYPEPRIRERGYATLLRTIIGQQVSVQAAASIWAKLETRSAISPIPPRSPPPVTRRCAPPASPARRRAMRAAWPMR